MAGDYAADKANDGLGGFSGDGGPATSAQLNDPQGVAVDSAGDLFIADTFNNAIREVTPAGIITTVVNTAAPKAPRRRKAAAPPHRLQAQHPLRRRIDPSTDDLTSPTPTTARSPRSPAWPSPATRPARRPRPVLTRAAQDEEETYMTDNARIRSARR